MATELLVTLEHLPGMYDAIVVGTRVAGASTAMLMARAGLRVLAVDRARFPSDTLSTHVVMVQGCARLARWGLLDRVLATGTPPTRSIRLAQGPVVLKGRPPVVDGVDAICCARRTVLDAILVEGAREAGAEVREGFKVEDLVFEDGRVIGIRGKEQGGGPTTELARLVVGADGRRSMVAASVKAAQYRDVPPRSIAYYSYWSEVDLEGAELYAIPSRSFMSAWPTNDGLVMAGVTAPAADFPEFRRDPEGCLLRSLDDAGDLGERVRAGRRAERVYGTADLASHFHAAHGPGWALVGDAGLVLDPITAQGIADGLRDAELLAEAVVSGLDAGGSLEAALSAYQSRRDAAALGMYEFTADLVEFRPLLVSQLQLLRAIENRPEQIDRFVSMLTGATSPSDYFAPRNLLAVLGPRRMLKVAVKGNRVAA